jgi:MFS family permease
MGAAVLVVAMVMLSLGIEVADGDLTAWHLVPGLALGGVGFGLVAPVVVDFVLSSAPESDAGGASGAVNTVVQIAGAVGIASVGAIFQTTLASQGDVDVAAQRALLYPLAAFAVGLFLSRGRPARVRAEHHEALDA